MGAWKSIEKPPKKNGRYMVKFMFYPRHETDQTEIAFRKFNNGNWITPYYNKPSENSKIIAWLDEEE